MPTPVKHNNKNFDFLVNADKFCDYVPLLSFLSNTVDLIGKGILGINRSIFGEKETIKNNHYYTHLKHKSVGQCVVLAIPVIGTIYAVILNASEEKLRESYQSLNAHIKKSLKKSLKKSSDKVTDRTQVGKKDEEDIESSPKEISSTGTTLENIKPKMTQLEISIAKRAKIFDSENQEMSKEQLEISLESHAANPQTLKDYPHLAENRDYVEMLYVRNPDIVFFIPEDLLNNPEIQKMFYYYDVAKGRKDTHFRAVAAHLDQQ
jgi:hypothetical protein